MAPSRILDTHIHLWPSTSVQPSNHGWMTPGHQLAKRHGISDYMAVTDPVPLGFVYVETDRYLPSPQPDISGNESESEQRRKLQEWAEEPLRELKFLRRLVEGKGQEGDGFERGDVATMKGCVVWAPFNVSKPLFEMYMQMAEEIAGPELWKRVVGFRYLLQGKVDGEVKKLTSNDDWLENIVRLGQGRSGNGRAFDIGVDTHRDGDEMLEVIGDMIEEVRRREDKNGGKKQRIRFILSKSPALMCMKPTAVRNAVNVYQTIYANQTSRTQHHLTAG
jgi:L-rhamnono-1,4-lactonase